MRQRRDCTTGSKPRPHRRIKAQIHRRQHAAEGLRRPSVAEGDRIRFTSTDGTVIDGMAVQVLDTSGGNYRMRIHIDEPAPSRADNYGCKPWAHSRPTGIQRGIHGKRLHRRFFRRLPRAWCQQWLHPNGGAPRSKPPAPWSGRPVEPAQPAASNCRSSEHARIELRELPEIRSGLDATEVRGNVRTLSRTRGSACWEMMRYGRACVTTD